MDKLVKRVGEAQAKVDEELEVSVSLPGGKELDFFYAEADGVFVRTTEKKKSYEG